MIKAIVLDIDGVIVGNQEGFNFPHPSKKVIKALKKIHDSGIPVSFLSGKPSFTAAKNIKAVGIDNPHIADGGATIFNPIRNQIIHTVTISSEKIKQVLEVLPKDTYLNLFTTSTYFIKRSSKNKFTDLYSRFAGEYPVLFDNIDEILKREKITKINIYSFNDKEKTDIEKGVSKVSNINHSNWSTNPIIEPVRVKVITAENVSKKTGVTYLAKYLKVPLKNVLGVGDTMHDWEFLEICGYKAAMGNATDELKEKIDSSDPKDFIGGHINDDGIIDVFKHFKLI